MLKILHPYLLDDLVVPRVKKPEHCNAIFADFEIMFGTIPTRRTLSADADYEVLKGVSFGFPMVNIWIIQTSDRKYLEKRSYW